MTALKILSDENKVDSITKALGGSRRIFPDVNQALAMIIEAGGTTENFHGLPLALAHVDLESGEVDESKYVGMNAMVATVGARVDNGTKKLNGIKGVVLLPVPTLESYLASDVGKAWLEKIAEKESAHVSFRPFREAETTELFLSGLDRVPDSVDAFATESSRSGGTDTELFDTVWRPLRTQLGKDKPQLAKLLPQKPEIIKSIRSAAYAKENYPELENANVFKWLATLVINGAGAMPTDSVKAWLDGRDTFVFPTREAAAADFSVLEGLDLGAMGEADESTDDTDEATPATEPAKA